MSDQHTSHHISGFAADFRAGQASLNSSSTGEWTHRRQGVLQGSQPCPCIWPSATLGMWLRDCNAWLGRKVPRALDRFGPRDAPEKRRGRSAIACGCAQQRLQSKFLTRSGHILLTLLTLSIACQRAWYGSSDSESLPVPPPPYLPLFPFRLLRYSPTECAKLFIS